MITNLKFDKPWKFGDIIRVPVGDSMFGFAQVLEEPLFAFFDYFSDEPEPDVQLVLDSQILFKIWVSKYARLNGEWRKISWARPSEEAQSEAVFFRQDSISKKIFKYNQNLDNTVPLDIETARKLECAAVWDPEHVIERLKAYHGDYPSIWVKRLAPKP